MFKNSSFRALRIIEVDLFQAEYLNLVRSVELLNELNGHVSHNFFMPRKSLGFCLFAWNKIDNLLLLVLTDICITLTSTENRKYFD